MTTKHRTKIQRVSLSEMYFFLFVRSLFRSICDDSKHDEFQCRTSQNVCVICYEVRVRKLSDRDENILPKESRSMWQTMCFEEKFRKKTTEENSPCTKPSVATWCVLHRDSVWKSCYQPSIDCELSKLRACICKKPVHLLSIHLNGGDTDSVIRCPKW